MKTYGHLHSLKEISVKLKFEYNLLFQTNASYNVLHKTDHFAYDKIFEVIYTRAEPIDENQRELIDYHSCE